MHFFWSFCLWFCSKMIQIVLQWATRILLLLIIQAQIFKVWHCVLNVLPIVIPGLPNAVILSKMLDSHRKSLVAFPHTGHGKSEVVHTAKASHVDSCKEACGVTFKFTDSTSNLPRRVNVVNQRHRHFQNGNMPFSMSEPNQ